MPIETPPQQQDDEKSRPSIVIILKAKPLPEVLPDSAQRDLAVLGRSIIVLSDQLLTLSADRDRELARVVITGDPLRDWEAQKNFRQETESLMTQRFGMRLSAHLFDLKALGVEQPFWAKDGSPKVLGRFLGAMGVFLEGGRVKEAIASAQDNNFWFTQQRGCRRGDPSAEAIRNLLHSDEGFEILVVL